MGMNFTMARINHQPLIVGFNYEHLKELFPNAPITPTAKSAMGIFPVSKVGRQIAPWRPRPQYPEYRVNKQPVISGLATNMPLPAGEMGLYIFPNPIRNIVSTVRVHSPSCRGVKRPYYIIYNLTTLSSREKK
jgi:hypothetical protein